MDPREWTQAEVEEQFLDHVAVMIAYWNSEGNSNVPADSTSRHRLEGLTHSLLAAIDGCSMALPGFTLAPSPHPEDRAFHIAEGENYYPEGPEAACDISGGLHELLYAAIAARQPR